MERQSYAGGCAANVEHSGYQFEPTHGLYCGWEPNVIFNRLFDELSLPAPRARLLSTPYLVRLPDGSDVARISGEDFKASAPEAFPECANAAIDFYSEVTNAGPSETKMRTALESRSFVW